MWYWLFYADFFITSITGRRSLHPVSDLLPARLRPRSSAPASVDGVGERLPPRLHQTELRHHRDLHCPHATAVTDRVHRIPLDQHKKLFYLTGAIIAPLAIAAGILPLPLGLKKLRNLPMPLLPDQIPAQKHHPLGCGP